MVLLLKVTLISASYPITSTPGNTDAAVILPFSYLDFKMETARFKRNVVKAVHHHTVLSCRNGKGKVVPVLN